MEKFLTGKNVLFTVGGLFGGVIAMAFGGWSEGLTTLVILMVMDYLTGLVVAGLFQASKKTESGGLGSKAGWKGLARKALTLVLVVALHRVDVAFGIDYLMNAAIVGFALNELISLVENAGLMGLPMPKAITKAIDVLTAKADEPEKTDLADD